MTEWLLINIQSEHNVVDYLEIQRMANALTDEQLNVLLEHINTRRYSARDRLLVILLHRYGLSVKELANLRLADLISVNGIKDQITTESRIIPITDKAKDEIKAFLARRFPSIALELIARSEEALGFHVFVSQKTGRGHFTRNTLNNYLFRLQKAAGVEASVGRHTYLTKLSTKVSPAIFIRLSGITTAKALVRYLPTPVEALGCLEAMDA
jgi:integrase/recombinase XerD